MSLSRPDNTFSTAYSVEHVNLALAKKLAARGLPVFPCLAKPFGKKKTKAPYTSNGFKDATVSIAQIDEWWMQWPDALVGLPTGAVSGIAVLDGDIDRETGEAIGEGQIATLGLFDNSAIVVTTPSGGVHLLFKYAEGVKTSAKQIASNVDVRGDGGYIIAPETVLPDGSKYSCVNRTLFDALEANDLPVFPLIAVQDVIARKRDEKAAQSHEMAISDYLPKTLASDVETFQFLINALAVATNDLKRNSWVKLAISLKAGFGESLRDDFISFSCRYVAGDCTIEVAEYVWKSAGVGHTITGIQPALDMLKSALGDAKWKSIWRDVFAGRDALPKSDERILQLSSEQHPLSKFLDPLPAQSSATEFVIDGVLAAGMTLLAGGWGAGKTSQLVPLLVRAAWLCDPDDPLKPKLRRRVIYISEDVGQVQRILSAMAFNGDLGSEVSEVEDYFKVVQAERISAEYAVRVAQMYEGLTILNKNSITGATYPAKPLIVFDTRSAALDLQDENDNTEAGRVIATLRRGFAGFPTLIVGHLSKALKRADTASMSGRGAGAWEADVQQVLYLVNDEGERFLDVATPKHRFTSDVDGVSFRGVCASITAIDVLGDEVTEDVFYGVPTLVNRGGRADRKEEEAKARADEAVLAARSAILELARTWRNAGIALNRSVLAAHVGGRKGDALALVDKLLFESWIVEIEIPRKVRRHPRQGAYLIGLTAPEREAFLKDGVLPDGHEKPPAAFIKPFISTNSSVPDDTGEKVEATGDQAAKKADQHVDSIGSRFIGSPKEK